MKLSSSFIALSLSGALLGLSACSGGGGGGSPSPVPTPSPTPTPTPTPTNSPPTGVIDTPDGTSADEGQTARMDASGSTDPDGDALSFAWTQTSGPSVTIDDTTMPTISVTLPEVDQDTDLTFSVEISDGTATVSQSVTIEVKNYARSPLSSQFGGIIGDLDLGADDAFDLFTGGPRDGDGFAAYLMFQDVQGDLFLERLGIQDSNLIEQPLERSSERVMLPGGSLMTDDPFVLETNFSSILGPDVILLDRESGDLSIFQTEFPGGPITATASGTFNIADACNVTRALVRGPSPTTGFSVIDLLVGSNSGGFTILYNDGFEDSSEYGNFSTSEIVTTSPGLCFFRAFNDLYAFDPINSEIFEIEEPVGTSPNFGTRISVGIDAQRFTLVDAQPGIGQGGQEFQALLLTDGDHAGEHYLFTMYWLQSGGIETELLRLPNGVPAELISTSVDVFGTNGIDFDSDLIIRVPDTPYVYIRENLSERDDNRVTFGPLQFFEVGFGAEEITTVSVSGNGARELLVINEENRLLSFFNEEMP